MHAPSRSLVVNLTWSEVMHAALVGVQRHGHALRRGHRHRQGFDPDIGWQGHIEGACGECALAKWLGVYWSGDVADSDADDVGPYQVRTAARDTDRLRLHSWDKDHKPYILALGIAPRFRLAGWLYARDGKKPDYWCDPTHKNRPAFFIPQNVLSPMSELPALDIIGVW